MTTPAPPELDDRARNSSPSRFHRSRWLSVGLLVGLSVGFLTWAYVRFQSPLVALAYLRGDSLALSRQVVTLGRGKIGESRDLEFQVWNFAEVPLRVIGSNSSCACVTSRGLPMDVPAGAARSLTVRVTFGPQPGPLHQSAVYYTDLPERPAFRVEFRGTSVE